MRGQTAKMTIEQKARLDEAAIFDGIKFDSISILCDTPQRVIPTLDLYPSDLGVRYPQRFGQMLDGLPPSKINDDPVLFPVSSQEIVQPAVE